MIWALVNPAVMWKARRKPYDGQRQDLTRDEIDKLFAALKRNRNGHRDYMIGLVCFLHGLRVSELIDLRWDDIDWRAGAIRIRRLKGSHDGVHMLERDEALGLRRLQREQDPKRPYGHANMSNTIGYVRMSPEPLKDVWRGRR